MISIIEIIIIEILIIIIIERLSGGVGNQEKRRSKWCGKSIIEIIIIEILMIIFIERASGVGNQGEIMRSWHRHRTPHHIWDNTGNAQSITHAHQKYTNTQ